MKQPRRKSPGPANIRDVAARAGVSPMTVSRVINREDNVKPETRELVNAAIRDLNYAPNPAARSLAGSAPFRIGLIYDNPSAGYLSELLVGSLDESARTGAQLIVERTSAGRTAADMLDKLIRNGVNGLILPSPLCEDEALLKRLRTADVALVAIAPGRESGDFATVRIDNVAAAYELTQHLLTLGHRRIGFIKGAANQPDGELRLEGFLKALKDAGLDPASAPIAQGEFTSRSGRDAARRLLAIEPRPTAIFAANDDMAAGVLRVAGERGLSVPRDLSICGYDDTPLSRQIFPSLTTVRQPTNDMGRVATEELLKAIRDPEAGDMVKMDYALQLRESTGPHRSRR